MTDELNQRITPEKEADQTVENPVDELARMMGYNKNPAPLGEPARAENTMASDLEAELMREFGIDALESESEAPSTTDEVFSAPEQAPVEPEMPEVRPERTTFTREPVEMPIYQPDNVQENDQDNVLAEMARYNVPNPQENIISNVNVPTDDNMPAVGDNFANDLEQELANLQNQLSDGLQINEPVDQAQEVISEHAHKIEEPITQSVETFQTVVDASVSQSVTEPVTQESYAGEVDMSAVIDANDDVEKTIEFDVPSIEPAVVNVAQEASYDADLDSELEEEFSQLYKDSNPQEAAENSSAEASNDSTQESAQDFSSFFDMSAVNEDQTGDSNDVSMDAAAPAVLMQPERIDVSQSQANWQDLQSTPNADNSNTGKFAAVGMFALLVLGAGGYFVYNNLSSADGGSSEPVLIKADNSPIKEEPADPGGTDVPNQDQAVYTQVEGNDTSVASQPSLVESTEEPVDIVQRTLDPNLLPLEGRDSVEKIEDRLVSGEQTDLSAANGTVQPLIVPKKVRTVVVQADGTIITREETAPEAPTQQAQADTPQPDQVFGNQNTVSQASADALSAASAEQEVAAVADDTPVVDPLVSANSGQVDNTDTSTTTDTSTNGETASAAPVTVETQTSVATQPAVTEPVAQPVENFSGYYMQIASQPSLAAAQSSYQNLVARYNSVLGGRGVEYQKADIAGKGTFHRVRIQVGERSEANSLCSRYKSAGGSCFVTR